MTDLRPVTVDKRVTHDDKQPPFEICVLVVTFFVKHCLEQGILQQIFRLLPVRCQFVRETEQFVLYAKQLFFKIEFLHRLCRFPVPEVSVKGRTAFPNKKSLSDLTTFQIWNYLTSIALNVFCFSSSFIFGISMDRIPCSTFAEILSFSTFSGSRMVCWNLE